MRKRSSKKSTSTKPPTASKTNAGLKGRVAELERALTEAHRQQAATTEVLRAIGRSTVNLDAVLHTILSTAARLCDTGPAEIFRRDGDVYRFAVGQVAGQAYREQQEKTIRPGRGTAIGRAVLEKRPIQILDAWDDPEYEDQAAARIENFHTMLAVPLLRDGEPIGAFAAARHRVEPFTESQIKTVSSFADQAVIAIENARLFDELQERTAELAESLQQQTGTAEVLQAISRSTFDRDSILHMLIKTAARICDTGPASIYLRDGEMYRWAASQILDPVYLEHEKKNVMCAGRGSLVGRAALERRPVQLFDAWDDPEYEEKAELRRANLRTILAVPMLRNGEPVGVFCLARERLEPFTESQIKLVSTFADQAVIAIENARLFDEVQKRTGDLTEALQQQTATAEVLQTISRSSFDVDAILQTLVETAARLCNAGPAQIFRRDGDIYRYAASRILEPAYREHEQRIEIRPGRGTLVGRVALEKQPVQILDAWVDAEYEEKDAARVGNVRSMLAVPLLRDGEPIGAFALARDYVEPFTDSQVKLVSTFADQAVIAIENVRLFNETREALERQTATADILKVIASSPSDLQPVFYAIADRANRLLAGHSSAVWIIDGDTVRLVSATSTGQEGDLALQALASKMRAEDYPHIEAHRRGEVVYLEDMNDPNVPPLLREIARARGFRSSIHVPLISDSGTIGIIVTTRKQPGGFAEKDVDLLRTFADQAVIAIHNSELFEKLQARTRELSQSLDELRTAQDRLVQTEKLASLGQLTAGIAHEIKNPLNFVNNFSALSAELVDELNDALVDIALEPKKREVVNEIRDLLKSNLEKVVQHGKRADSIVKNMLLHSRQGSGEQRRVEVNALIDESLNLAYHGARAEKQGFNITVERDFDPSAGTAEVYPQEITRVLLNLISNGFYAATKRATEVGNGFEPKLKAATKNLGEKVEIRVRDNGAGIPSEIKDKIFTPFFTTKPAGEGTGLGLSMSHDIIVKQHGGKIDLQTEPGSFTEFVITLPRKSADQNSAGAVT